MLHRMLRLAGRTHAAPSAGAARAEVSRTPHHQAARHHLPRPQSSWSSSSSSSARPPKSSASPLQPPNTITFGGGGAATDALLSGSVDIVTTGASNMLLLWDRTKWPGERPRRLVRHPHVAHQQQPGRHFPPATSSPPTRSPSPPSRSAARPSSCRSPPAKLFGDAHFDHFDAMTVTLGHPDAQASLTSGGGALTGHFSGAPYQAAEAGGARPARRHHQSDAILGGPYSNAVYFTNTRFHDAKPGRHQGLPRRRQSRRSLHRRQPARGLRAVPQSHRREGHRGHAAQTRSATPQRASRSPRSA